MVSLEQEMFFELVRAGLFPGRTARILSHGVPVDWSAVYRLAEEQSVIGLVAAGIETLPTSERPPQEVVLQFVGQTLQLELRNRAMNAFSARLIKQLREEEVYAVLVKGQGIAQCYEKPLWRACGDVDLLLSESNYEKAKKALIPMASSVEEEDEGRKHLGLVIDSWVVELHGTLHTYQFPRLNKVIDELQGDVFNKGSVRTWQNGNTQVFLPAPDNDVVFVFFHIVQHFFGGGIGLRQICDWCRLLLTYKEMLNLTLIKERLQAAGIMTEWNAFAALAVKYLGMNEDIMPFYSPERKWGKKADGILCMILETGNFGHNRDMAYLRERPFVVRKAISVQRSTKDGLRHLEMFPKDAVVAWVRKMMLGFRKTAKGI